MKDLEDIPNDQTIKAIEEANNDINMTTIEDLKVYIQTLIDDEV